MKNLLFLLVIFPLACFADARIELDTSTCHAPWSSWNAEQAHEFACEANSIRRADGKYNAFYEGWFLTTRAGLGNSEAPEGVIPIIHETDCATFPGVFRDARGIEYKTTNCRVYLAYRIWSFSIEQGRPERFRVDVVIELNGLLQVGEISWDEED